MNKKSHNLITSFLLLSFIFLLFFVLVKKENISSKANYIRIAGQNIKVDLALDEKTRIQGLSGRSNLGEDEGMLFIFDSPGKYSFWMKDMNFSIDMVWLNKDQKIIYIKENASPESFPNSFGPNEEALYVLELVAGFTREHGVAIGDQIMFDIR